MINSSNILDVLPIEMFGNILEYLPKKNQKDLRVVNHQMKGIVEFYLKGKERDQLTVVENKFKQKRIEEKKQARIAKRKNLAKKIGKGTVIATSPITLPALAVITVVGMPVALALGIATLLPLHKNETCAAVVASPVILPASGLSKIVKTIKNVVKNGLN